MKLRDKSARRIAEPKDQEPNGSEKTGRRVRYEVAAVAIISIVLFTVAPSSIDRWVGLGWLAALLPVSILAGRWTEPGRVGVRPLTIFAFAFIVIMGSRALVLAAGDEGRYFAVDPETGATISRFAVDIEQDEPEASVAIPEVEVPGDAPKGFNGTIALTSGDARFGEQFFRLSIDSPRRAGYAAVELPGPTSPYIAVREGEPAAAVVAVRQSKALPKDTSVQLFMRYRDAEGIAIADVPISERTPASDQPGWKYITGETDVPEGVSTAAVLVVVRPVPAGKPIKIDLDAPLLIAGDDSAASYLPDSPTQAGDADLLERALAICIVLLSAVILGYLLPAGSRVARLVPPLRIPSFKEPRTRKTATALLLVGLLGYFLEMRSYGGYGGYLDSLSEIGSAGLGKWYLHAMAILPAGMAVLIFARRLADRDWKDWSKLELATLVVGTVIPLSYVLKAALAIPILTALLFAAFVRKRGWMAIWGAGAVFAALSPVVYEVRYTGGKGLESLFTSAYWSDFGRSLTSRFFHFESLMITVPSPSSDPPWQPVSDFVVGIVPRALWEGKPLSTSARFTVEHLQSSLYSGTDVGIISLPGELWLVGGTIAIIVCGIGLGILLRAVHRVVTRRRQDGSLEAKSGTILLAAGVLTGLIFLLDGWGLASCLTVMLISSAGWFLLLRKAPNV